MNHKEELISALIEQQRVRRDVLGMVEKLLPIGSVQMVQWGRGYAAMYVEGFTKDWQSGSPLDIRFRHCRTGKYHWRDLWQVEGFEWWYDDYRKAREAGGVK